MEEILTKARESMHVRTVYAEPIERDGVIVVPAAKVRGGGGGGGGRSGEEEAGWGGGFGLSASPAGAFVIKGGVVRWMPAVDVNRIVLMAQVVAIVFLLTVRSLAKTRAKANARK